MIRAEALQLVKDQVKNKNLVKHMLATEAVMCRLAEQMGEDPALWGLTGLLHDVDYDQTVDAPQQHGLVGARLLEDKGYPDALIQAVKAHNEALGFAAETLMDKALYAVDPVTGLLVAAALIHPEKKLAAVTVDFVLNRFKEKSFARGADRGQIESCVDLGYTLEEFIGISLEAMQNIAREIGL